MTEISIEAEYEDYEGDTPVTKKRQATGDSPCYGCKNEFGCKNECVEHCERLKSFQFNKKFQHLPYYQKTLIVPQNANALPEKPITVKPAIQELTPWKKTFPVKQKKPAVQNAECIFPGCNNTAVRRKNTICLACYQAWRRGKKDHPVLGSWKTLTGQEIAQGRARNFKKCLMPGCNNSGNKRELCQACYKRWHKGLILHPKLGSFVRKDGRVLEKKEVNPMSENSVKYETIKKDEKAVPGTNEMHAILLDFVNYQEIYKELKAQAKTTKLPLNHIIFNTLSIGIKALYDENERRAV